MLRIALLVFFLIQLVSGKSFSVSGFVFEEHSKETLPYANIILEGYEIGTSSNNEGYYTLANLDSGEYHIRCYYIGYQTYKKTITISNDDVQLDIILKPDLLESDAVIVYGKNYKSGSQVSAIKLHSTDLNITPALGEQDLIQVLQTLPGVNFEHEMSSSITIRGADNEQTQFVIDGIPVFYPAHLYGIFSAFNSSFIKNVNLMKGGFPAQYSGSGSVIEIFTKDGNFEQLKIETSVGLISSRINLEGPVGKGSWYLGARRTYLDLILKLFNPKSKRSIPQYYFYDLNGKIKYPLSENDFLFFSFLYSNDVFSWTDKIVDENYNENFDNERLDYNWQNSFFALKYLHLSSSNVFLTSRVYLSKYNNFLQSSDLFLFQRTPGPYIDGAPKVTYQSDMTNFGFISEIEYKYSSANNFKLGLWAKSNSIEFNGYRSYTADRKNHIAKKIFHYGFYLQNEQTFLSNLDLIIGLRGNLYNYSDIEYEPRFSYSWQISSHFKMKGAAGVYRQYYHMLKSDAFNVFSTMNFYFPAQNDFQGVISRQIVSGFEYKLYPGYTLDVEGYYSTFKNNVLPRLQTRGFNNLSGLFYKGDGKAFGLDFYLRKELGSFNGWIGYSLSHSLRTFPEINSGEEFFSEQHRLHNINISLQYNLSENWKIKIAWRWANGLPYTATLGRAGTLYADSPFDNGNNRIIYRYRNFSERNKYRLPAYHRLDASVSRLYNYQTWKMRLNINIFNVYNRFNTVKMDEFPDDNQVKYFTLLPFTPTISVDMFY